MNKDKKSTTPRGVQFKPVVAQMKTGISAQSIKRPVAPPVYRPTTTPQLKIANGVVNRNLPAAPPVYRPEAKKILQPKTISQQSRIANSIRPITTKTTTSRFHAVQLAAAAAAAVVAEEKKAHQCSAKVVSSTGQEYSGDYDGMHAEINALEKYFAAGGAVAGITRINLSSSCCKYCTVILSDLGILDKVVTDDQRKYGRCQGGSYGWFTRGGSLWKAIKAATGAEDEDKYSISVSARAAKLK